MNQKLKRIRQIFVVLVLIAAVEGFSSCEKYSYAPAAIDPNQTWHFQTDIQPIFNANCVICHNGVKEFPDLREGKAYKSLKGEFVALPAETSKLYHQISTNSDHIPRTTDTEKLKILYWISQGALNN